MEEFFRVLYNGGKIIIDINANDTTYVKKAKEKLNNNVFLTRPSQSASEKYCKKTTDFEKNSSEKRSTDSREIESEPSLMYFPESVDEFVKIVDKCGFSINDVGYSNFKYINCTNHEYIICAQKD